MMEEIMKKRGEMMQKKKDVNLNKPQTNNKNDQTNIKEKEIAKKESKDAIKPKNVIQKNINTPKPPNPFIQNNRNINNNNNNKNINNQKQNQNNIANTNISNNNKPKDKIQENLSNKKFIKDKDKDKNIISNNNNSNINNDSNINKNSNINNNSKTNNNIKTIAPTSTTEPKVNNNEKKANNISLNNAIVPKESKKIKNEINSNNNINNNKEIKKEKNKEKNKEKKNERPKSLNKINNNYKLEGDIINNEIKKSKSIKNKISKINLDNFTPKKNEIQKNLYDDGIEELDDVIKIDDLAHGNDKKPQLKRTKTSNQDHQKEQIGIKKRHSLLDDNNCLTIKLKSKNNYTKEDFEVVTFSGKGAYGTVLQVHLINDPKKKIYAIKKLDINSLYSVNRLYQAYLENDILNELDSPYIVKVYGAFESDGKIHLVMDYLPKGDFSYFIKSNFPLKEDLIRFYSAEMVLFLEYMQKMKLIHRDLKPQNIMIDEKGHLKVIDFGTVRKVGYYYDKKEMRFKEEKLFERIDSEDIKGVKNIVNPDMEDADEDDDDEDEEDEEDENEENENNELSEKKKKKIQKVRVKRSMTFVGTAEYISPEVIGDRPAEFGTDIWAFGVMLYQMYFNDTPFKAATTYLTFRNIEKPQISFPNNKISDQAKDLILKILVVEPKQRLGGGEPGTKYDIANLKKHPFFKKIKWNNLYNTSPPGFKDLKYYECKKKSIYKKNQDNDNDNCDGYVVFDDKSRDKNKNAPIIRQGYIKKKSLWFHYEKRYIILDATPEIILKSVNEENYYRLIPLTKKCKVTLVENNCFDLKTPEKTHRFKGTQNDGNDWAGVIVDAINAYAKE